MSSSLIPSASLRAASLHSTIPGSAMMCPTYAAHCATSLTSYVVGPIDCRISLAEVNELAMTKPIAKSEQNLIGIVPARYPVAIRQVYPGFLQLMAFRKMNRGGTPICFVSSTTTCSKGTPRKRMRGSLSRSANDLKLSLDPLRVQPQRKDANTLRA